MFDQVKKSGSIHWLFTKRYRYRKIGEKRLKIVWLSGVHNPYIAHQLGIDEGFEFAPWVTRYAELFKKTNSADIHIISLHREIRKKKVIKDHNITYHFLPYKYPRVPRWVKKILGPFTVQKVQENWNPNLLTDYKWIKTRLRKIIDDIDPDLIHLFGTANAFFTSSIFQFRNKYPVLIGLQENLNESPRTSRHIEYCKKIEIELYKRFDYFGTLIEPMKTIIKQYNPRAKVFTILIAPYKPKIHSLPDGQKEYDLIFFARITREKGVEDLLEALALIKKPFKDIRLALVGKISDSYRVLLEKRMNELNVRAHIDFLGPQKTLDEVHQIAAKSKLSVLPTHTDAIPGTLLESMQMGLPCVAYKVGGIPSLGNHIVSVEKGNIEQLANEIVTLLQDDMLRVELADRARKYVEKRWSETVILDTLLNAYREIL